MKLFQTNSIEIVRACQESFGFEVASVLLKKNGNLEMYFHALNLCDKKINIVIIFIYALYNCCTVIERS